MAEWQAEWHVFSHPMTQSPPFILARQQLEDQVWWGGLLTPLSPMLERCHNLAAPKVENYREGSGIPPHPSHVGLLHTECLVVSNAKGFCSQYPQRFRWQAHGRQGHKGRGANAGYIKVREQGLYQRVPWREFFLHQLLCWMYRGPPPDGGLEVCHMCQKKTCVAPWHLVWGTGSENALGHVQHKRKRWELMGDYAHLPVGGA